MLNTFDDTAGSPLAHMWGAELLRGGAHAHAVRRTRGGRAARSCDDDDRELFDFFASTTVDIKTSDNARYQSISRVIFLKIPL